MHLMEVHETAAPEHLTHELVNELSLLRAEMASMHCEGLRTLTEQIP